TPPLARRTSCSRPAGRSSDLPRAAAVPAADFRRLLRRVLRADFYGLRDEKVFALSRITIANTGWITADAEAPFFLFPRQDGERAAQWAKGLPLPEIFPVHGTGVITGRDALFTGFDRKSLEARLARE